MLLPTIYPITDTKLAGISHREQVKALIDGGARIIQIRDKTLTSRDLFAAIQACQADRKSVV